MIKQNLHTHSLYCDGKDTLEDMVQMAIEKNFTILGFSGHGYIPQDEDCMSLEGTEEYKKEVKRLKEKYKDQIQIYLGLEEDTRCRDAHPESYDYMIGSMHFLSRDNQYIAVDYSESVIQDMIQNWYNGSFLKLSKEYYERVQILADFDEIQIVGHIDLLMKYNEDEEYISFEDEVYLKYAKEAIDVLLNANKIFEVNTGAIARGYRKSPYPYRNLLRYIYEQGGKILLNSDCHNKENLDIYYKESMQLIQECGFTSMMALTESGFKEFPLSAFSIE